MAKWYHDVLEASFILNLRILVVATYQVGGNHAAIAYTSVGVVFIITFIAIILYHIYLQAGVSRFWRVRCCQRDECQQDNELEETTDADMSSRPMDAPTTSVVFYESFRQIQEPLLESQEDFLCVRQCTDCV